jgi:hypothetical protein
MCKNLWLIHFERVALFRPKVRVSSMNSLARHEQMQKQEETMTSTHSYLTRHIP